MDYVTRQFINLTKKFRKELRKALSDLNSALHKQTEAIRESYQVSNDKQSPLPEVTVLNNLPSSIEVHQNKKDTKDERNYQRFMFLVTTMTLGALVIYADLVYLQYCEMIKATNAAARTADAAQKQFEASERPWIKILDAQTRGNSEIVPALSFQRSPNWPRGIQQTTFQLDISYKNIGRSVARVTVDFQLFLPLWKNGYSDVILADERKFCDSIARINPAPTLSVINFPGDETYHWYGGGAATVKDETTNYFSDRKLGVGYIVPVVAVCVSYQFGDSPKVYQTRALFEVFRKDDRTRFFEAGIGVPARHIFMLRNQSGDAAY
jgi:hypothetical protein